MGTFVQGEEGLKSMMKSIKVPLDKEGVGLNFNKRVTALKYEGRQGKPYKYAMPWTSCKKCGNKGHLAQNCRSQRATRVYQKGADKKPAYRNKQTASRNDSGRTQRTKNSSPKVVQLWIKKSELNVLYILATNQSGPKPTWVPKG